MLQIQVPTGAQHIREIIQQFTSTGLPGCACFSTASRELLQQVRHSRQSQGRPEQNSSNVQARQQHAQLNMLDGKRLSRITRICFHVQLRLACIVGVRNISGQGHSSHRDSLGCRYIMRNRIYTVCTPCYAFDSRRFISSSSDAHKKL